MTEPPSDVEDPSQPDRALRSFIDMHHDELLRATPLEGSSKCAFLSTLTNAKSEETSRSSLDSFLVNLIFKFAATGEVRRRVL